MPASASLLPRRRSRPAAHKGGRARERAKRKLGLNRLEDSTMVSSGLAEVIGMCRNIKTLFNFDPPVTAEEIQNASLQFVRKISGFNKPSRTNESSFLAAVDEIAAVSSRLIHSLETNAPPKNREEEATKAKARAATRFGD